jgi:hypothetical protein
MPRLIVDRFTFDFPAGWSLLKYDDCTFYREHFNSLAHSKALDLLALSPAPSELWMIEIKDYRRARRTKPGNLFTEVARKARDTLAGLAVARMNANDALSKGFAAEAMRAGRVRVVFLLEQPEKPSKVFPHVVNPATARTELKRALRAIDPHPVFGNAGALTAKTAWTVTPP